MFHANKRKFNYNVLLIKFIQALFLKIKNSMKK